MSIHDNFLDRLRRPEHTGENRCLPCTVVNTVIAMILAGLLALVWLPFGVTGFIVTVGLIYLRGYLIPGTPAITQRYFPEWLLRMFGKESIETTPSISQAETESSASMMGTVQNGGADDTDERDIESLLEAAEVVEECPDDDDLCLTNQFREVWWQRIRTLREDREEAMERLAATLDVDPAEIQLDDSGSRFVVTYEGDRIGVWDSDAAFYADLAVEPTLGEQIAEWQDLTDRERTQLIAGMRAFLERCPSCEASVEQAENVRETCCSSRVVGVDVDCSSCGARIFSGRY